MTTDPIKKKILASYMEDAGLSPNDILSVTSTTPETQQLQAPSRAGGGVSAPSAPSPLAPNLTRPTTV